MLAAVALRLFSSQQRAVSGPQPHHGGAAVHVSESSDTLSTRKEERMRQLSRHAMGMAISAEKPTLPNTVTTTASHITTRDTTGRITSTETETSTSVQSNTTTDNTTLSTTTNKLDKPYPTESSTSGKSELPAPTVSKSQPTETQSTHISTKLLPTKSHLQKDSPENTLLNAEAAPNNPEENDVKEQQPSYHKGILIGVGCVVALIVIVVLVFLYKICQKKPPEAEHSGTKVSAQEKESVTLLSVKTSATDSEAKRTALPHQTEYIIEC